MQDRSDSRDLVLDRAATLGSVEGLGGLTIGRLAGELGMSKSGLFGLFGSKRELQLATVERARDVLWREVVEPASAEPAGLPRLRALIEGYLRYLERGVFPGGCFVSAAAAEFDGQPGPVRDAIAEVSREWRAELLEQAKLARRNGEIPDETDAGQLVFELAAFTSAANFSHQLHGDRRVFRRARRAIASRLP